MVNRKAQVKKVSAKPTRWNRANGKTWARNTLTVVTEKTAEPDELLEEKDQNGRERRQADEAKTTNVGARPVTWAKTSAEEN